MNALSAFVVDESKYAEALGEMRGLLAQFRAAGYYDQGLIDKAAVLAWFQPIFDPAHLSGLTMAEFVPFLNFKNNKHWYGLHRLSGRLASNLDALRAGLAILVDERLPISERLDKAVTGVHGLGKGVATPILMISYPERYGVWNSVSESGLRLLGLWPDFPRGVSMGTTYAAINDLLLRMAGDLNIDLWILDALWHQLRVREAGEAVGDFIEDVIEILPVSEGTHFGLERHLHDFLYDNWDRTDLGKEWALYGDPGDDYPGYEYQTDVGRIDLLARHRRESRWLVVELKRGQTSDQTVGQAMRYMGWVKQHLSKPGDRVEGLIIAREADKSLLYALAVEQAVALNLYEVEFRLRPSSLNGGSDA